MFLDPLIRTLQVEQTSNPMESRRIFVASRRLVGETDDDGAAGDGGLADGSVSSRATSGRAASFRPRFSYAIVMIELRSEKYEVAIALKVSIVRGLV
jgi:hypothetical protein